MKKLIYCLAVVMIVLPAYSSWCQQPTIIIPPSFCDEHRSTALILHKGLSYVKNSCIQDVYLVSGFEMQAYRAADTLMQNYINGQIPEQEEIVIYKQLLQTCEDSRQDIIQTFDSSLKQTLSSLDNTVAGLKSTVILLNTAHTDLDNARLNLEIATKEMKHSKKHYFWKQATAWAGGMLLGGLLVAVVK